MIRTTRTRPDARPKSPWRSVAALLLPIAALIAGCLLSPSILLGQATPTPIPNANTNTTTKTPLLLAHYMPWYEAKPIAPRWGWHWTMNHFDPDRQVDGKPQIASHYSPLIGPYDSSDPHLLEYHFLTMKLAGIDGVIVDWYGLTDFRDYATLHRNTTRALQQAERLKMKFAICYEDQTITALAEANRLAPTDRVRHAADEIRWLGKYWFNSPSYVRLDSKPLLLSFGHAGLTDDEWSRCLEQAETPVAYFSEHRRRAAAVGPFDWPIPKEPLRAVDRFYADPQTGPRFIPVAFPRFVDIYAEAKVGPGYGRFDDDGGKTFRELLKRGLTANVPAVQIATWNDWGEGTMIEPSIEFGYRDLETIRQVRRELGQASGAVTDAQALRLPYKLLQLRRADSNGNTPNPRLDRIANLLATGKISEAIEAMK